MKKFSVLLTLAVLMVSSSVFAGSIDYLSNQSAKYCMNTASTARTDGADIVAYNPAGTALLGQGFFIDVSNQTLLKYYEQDNSRAGAAVVGVTGKETYEQDTPTLLLPNVYVAYNFGEMGPGKLAVFGQAGVVAGGGSLEWDGTAMTYGLGTTIGLMLAGGGFATTVDNIDLTTKASSVYYGFGLGAAYAFLEDMLSVSAGARYTMARRTGESSGTIDYTTAGAGGDWRINIDSEYDYDAEGITPIIGLDIKPTKELTIGIRYEFETPLEFKYDQSKNNVSLTGTAGAAVNAAATALLGGATMEQYLAGMLNVDGTKSDYNLPQILSIGAEYVVMPELTVGVSSNIYFLSEADMDGMEEYFGTGYEIAVGASYKVMEPLKISASIMYTDQGAKDKLYEEDTFLKVVSANPVLDSIFMGLGATYTVIPNLDITAAVSWVHYLPKDVDITESNVGDTIEASYSKELYNIALGASYKI